MVGNQGHAKMTPNPNSPHPTRHNTNHNWSYRGDNTKYKLTK